MIANAQQDTEIKRSNYRRNSNVNEEKVRMFFPLIYASLCKIHHVASLWIRFLFSHRFSFKKVRGHEGQFILCVRSSVFMTVECVFVWRGITGRNWTKVEEVSCPFFFVSCIHVSYAKFWLDKKTLRQNVSYWDTQLCTNKCLRSTR